MSLLLHFNGSNGSQSFADSSGNSVAVTTESAAAISTTESKFGGASALFDGASGGLSVGSQSDFNLGAGSQPFTLEMWFYKASSGTQVLFSKNGGNTSSWSASDGLQMELYVSGTAVAFVWRSEGDSNQIQGGQASLDAWHHIAVSYDGTTTGLFLDGMSIGTSSATYDTVLDGTPSVTIGEEGGSFVWDGYIDELRISSECVYPPGEDFTPPEAEFTGP